MTHAEVILITSRLEQKDKDMIILDFERGSQHIYLIMFLKCSHWNQNPWKLLSMGHMLVATAREHCKQAYSVAQLATSDDARKEQHRVTQLLCYPGTRLHQEFLLFLNGDDDFTELPQSANLRGRMQLMSIHASHVHP